MANKPEKSALALLTSGKNNNLAISSRLIEHPNVFVTSESQQFQFFRCVKCQVLVPENGLLNHTRKLCKNKSKSLTQEVNSPVPTQPQQQQQGEGQKRIVPTAKSSISCPSLSPSPSIPADTKEVPCDPIPAPTPTPAEPQNYDDLAFVCLKCCQSFSKTSGVDSQSHWSSCKNLPWQNDLKNDLTPAHTIPDYSFFQLNS